MKIGSLVEAISTFDDVRKEWGFNYPHKGDILTIQDIQPYTFGTMKGSKYVMLWFCELELPFGICSKNFREIQPPINVQEWIEECICVPVNNEI